MVLSCADEAISRIEQGAFSIALEDIKDISIIDITIIYIDNMYIIVLSV